MDKDFWSLRTFVITFVIQVECKQMSKFAEAAQLTRGRINSTPECFYSWQLFNNYFPYTHSNAQKMALSAFFYYIIKVINQIKSEKVEEKKKLGANCSCLS